MESDHSITELCVMESFFEMGKKAHKGFTDDRFMPYVMKVAVASDNQTHDDALNLAPGVHSVPGAGASNSGSRVLYFLDGKTAVVFAYYSDHESYMKAIDNKKVDKKHKDTRKLIDQGQGIDIETKILPEIRESEGALLQKIERQQHPQPVDNFEDLMNLLDDDRIVENLEVKVNISAYDERSPELIEETVSFKDLKDRIGELTEQGVKAKDIEVDLVITIHSETGDREEIAASSIDISPYGIDKNRAKLKTIAFIASGFDDIEVLQKKLDRQAEKVGKPPIDLKTHDFTDVEIIKMHRELLKTNPQTRIGNKSQVGDKR